MRKLVTFESTNRTFEFIDSGNDWTTVYKIDKSDNIAPRKRLVAFKGTIVDAISIIRKLNDAKQNIASL